jgi:MinD-like ATPase involved in chromosome partitioning or flagellar assembly
MAKIVAIHSFRGGTGKSNTTANLACLLAIMGKRVAIVDTDLQSPGIHVLFGHDAKGSSYALNDFLWGKCEVTSAANDVTEVAEITSCGRLFLVPASIRAGDIARILHYGYDVNLLKEGYHRLIRDLSLDFLFVDTHPGLNEETLLSIAISDILLILLRPDQQDYQGTAVTVEISRQLDVPQTYLILNKVPQDFDRETLASKVSATYDCKVAGVLTHEDRMMTLASSGIFVIRYPDDPLSGELRAIVREMAP